MTLRKHARHAFSILTLAGALALAGCHASRSVAGGQVLFPDPARASVKEGIFVNVEHLRNVAPGMTKRQLYDLLGHPHFNEGVFGVRRWNYLFDFRKSDGSGEVDVCQFQIEFDNGGIARNFYWKPEACKSVMDAPAPVAKAAALPATPIRLASDALFEFDRSVLTAAGRQHLEGLLLQVRAASQVEKIKVVGYTDTIGNRGYNHKLSRRRAEAVRDYLVAGGVPAAAMNVEGRGESDPLASCAQTRRKALIACLAPDRRVELSGLARP